MKKILLFIVLIVGISNVLVGNNQGKLLTIVNGSGDSIGIFYDPSDPPYWVWGIPVDSVTISASCEIGTGYNWRRYTMQLGDTLWLQYNNAFWTIYGTAYFTNPQYPSPIARLATPTIFRSGPNAPYLTFTAHNPSPQNWSLSIQTNAPKTRVRIFKTPGGSVLYENHTEQDYIVQKQLQPGNYTVFVFAFYPPGSSCQTEYTWRYSFTVI